MKDIFIKPFLGKDYYGTVPTCIICNVQRTLSCDQCKITVKQPKSGTHVSVSPNFAVI